MFKANFLSGLLVGTAVAVALPFAGAEVFATLSGPAQATAAAPVAVQAVNRAAKGDRLNAADKAVGRSAPKASKVLEGCDPAFSPLSKGAASANFSSRCVV